MNSNRPSLAKFYMLALKQDLKEQVKKDPKVIIQDFPELMNRLQILGLNDDQIAFVFSPIADREEKDLP